MATNESKTLTIAVVALVAFAGMMVWMLAGSSEGGKTDAEAEPDVAEPAPAPALPTQAKPLAAPPPTVAAPAAPALAAAELNDSDLFAGPMPDFMVDLHMRVLDNKWLGAPDQKQLYDFGQQHKDDARPQLLLAWDSMHRDWDGFAVRLYRMAYRADKRAKDDPSMLRDLIKIASTHDHVEFRETTEIVKEAYGEGALPRIDEELAKLRQTGDVGRSTRLQKLRDAIKPPS